MKVITLQAENFKKLKAVEITADPNIQVISGANGAGKSSVLDSIWSALSSADMTKETGTIQPIRDGEEKASVRLDLGDFIVTRKWTKSGSTVTVENRDGAVYKTPQSILDGLIGKISLDPLNFANSSEKNQKDVLLSMVKIDLDLNKNSADWAAAYENRTVLNREIKRVKITAEGLPKPVEGTPEVEVSAGPIIEAQTQAIEEQKANNAGRAVLNRLGDDLNKLSQEIEARKAETITIGQQIVSLEKQLSDKREILTRKQAEENAKAETYRAEQKRVAALIDPDLSVFAVQLRAVEETNKNVRARQAISKSMAEMLSLEKSVEQVTAEIDRIDKEKVDAIAAAKFPIEGLGFNDTGVTYNGIPFNQCSSGEKLRVSVAVAMATAPKLRIIRIADGSLIDSKNMEILETLAKEKDFQLWVERVDETGKVGVYIEDGMVVNK